MKYIITHLLIIFSASVLNARSVKLTYFYDKDTDTLTIAKVDSKSKDQKGFIILCDNLYLSVSKNKDTLKKLGDFLTDAVGTKYFYEWEQKDVINIMNIMQGIERSLIWADYQVSRHPNERIENQLVYYYYFYKQD